MCCAVLCTAFTGRQRGAAAAERRVLATTNKMKVLHFCLVLQVTNCLSKKQLAAMCVHSAPFVFDVEMICKALDQMGWE
jgi:hypothetical protein